MTPPPDPSPATTLETRRRRRRHTVAPVTLPFEREGAMDQRSLYERLGGVAAITAVVDDFVARCAADARINNAPPLAAV